MKRLFLTIFILKATAALASDCQAPGQGFLDIRIKETFHASLAQSELKEWMSHPSNSEVRRNLKSIDQRIKFSPQRSTREKLLAESQLQFEQAITNTGNPSLIKNFPAPSTESRVMSEQGALSIEMSRLSKEELDFLPKLVEDKLEPKIKIHYFFPYDKFEYFLTYDGRELPMEKALLKVQKDMEDNCERRVIQNGEDRRWYQKNHGGGGNGSGADQ